jgi:hypothetical protein
LSKGAAILILVILVSRPGDTYSGVGASRESG